MADTGAVRSGWDAPGHQCRWGIYTTQLANSPLGLLSSRASLWPLAGEERAAVRAAPALRRRSPGTSLCLVSWGGRRHQPHPWHQVEAGGSSWTSGPGTPGSCASTGLSSGLERGLRVCPSRLHGSRTPCPPIPPFSPAGCPGVSSSLISRGPQPLLEQPWITAGSGESAPSTVSEGSGASAGLRTRIRGVTSCLLSGTA